MNGHQLLAAGLAAVWFCVVVIWFAGLTAVYPVARPCPVGSRAFPCCPIGFPYTVGGIGVPACAREAAGGRMVFLQPVGRVGTTP